MKVERGLVTASNSKAIAMDWADDFDQLLTDIGAFPVLRQVIVDESMLKIVTIHQTRIPAWEITEAWFPRLLESRAIQLKLIPSATSGYFTLVTSLVAP